LHVLASSRAVVRDSSSILRLRPLTSKASLISSPSPERVREDARGERLQLRRARAFLHVGHVRLDARAVRAHLRGWSSGSGRVSLCVGRNVDITRRRFVVRSRVGTRNRPAIYTASRWTPVARRWRRSSPASPRARRSSRSPAHARCARVTSRGRRWTKHLSLGAKRQNVSSRFSPGDDLASCQWYKYRSGKQS